MGPVMLQLCNHWLGNWKKRIDPQNDCLIKNSVREDCKELPGDELQLGQDNLNQDLELWMPM
jgi:hypothetical protein